MANIKISQLNQYDGSDYSKVDVAGVDRQEGINVKVNLAPVNEIKNKVSDNTVAKGLTAGFAQMLLGNETPTEQTFTTQQTGGGTAADGVATYTEIKGESVVWNQMVTEESEIINNNGISYVFSNGDVTIDGTATSVSRATIVKKPCVADHYYLFHTGSQDLGITNDYVVYNNDDIVYEQRDGCDYKLQIASGVTFSNVKVRPIIIDLTKWYNGNVPAGLTAEKFLADYPWVLSMGYNEGTIVNNNTEAIKTKDSDGNVIGEISVKPHYIEGGLKSAGNVYDSKFADKEVQRVGVTDLKQYSAWKYSRDMGDCAIFACAIGELKPGSTANVMWVNSPTKDGWLNEEYIRIGGGYVNISVIKSKLSSVDNRGFAAWIRSLDNTECYFELATPIVHEYDQADNTSVEIVANGTEEAISSTPSTPVKVMARYSIDVYQAVKDLLAASQAEPQAE